MEVVGADHRDLGIILPGRAESDRKAGLQGDTDQLGGAGLAPQVVKTGLAEEEDSAQKSPGGAAAGLADPFRGATAGPQKSASYHYQKSSLSAHEQSPRGDCMIVERCSLGKRGNERLSGTAEGSRRALNAFLSRLRSWVLKGV